MLPSDVSADAYTMMTSVPRKLASYLRHRLFHAGTDFKGSYRHGWADMGTSLGGKLLDMRVLLITKIRK